MVEIGRHCATPEPVKTRHVILASVAGTATSPRGGAPIPSGARAGYQVRLTMRNAEDVVVTAAVRRVPVGRQREVPA